jgi:hypothetical protein
MKKLALILVCLSFMSPLMAAGNGCEKGNGKKSDCPRTQYCFVWDGEIICIKVINGKDPIPLPPQPPS